MRAGQYDRRIRIEQNSSAVDPQYGTAVPGWVAVAEVWAQVQDVLPSRAESQSDSVRLASRPSRIRVRWNVSLAAIGTGAMRIVQIDRGDRMLKIVAGPAEIGRRESLEFMAQEFSTSGDA